jgi:ClpP class serine protease
LFEEIQSEIHNSHDYFLQHISHKQSTTTLRLTVVATGRVDHLILPRNHGD